MPLVMRGSGLGGVGTGVEQHAEWIDENGPSLRNAWKTPITPQQERFNSIFPFLQGEYSKISSGTKTPLGQGPAIGTGPIWSGQQIQERVNQTRAQNDQQASGRINQMQGSMASRGFGTNSPLAQALEQMVQGQTMATNTGAENDLRWGAASGNAGHVLDAQKARADQYANYQKAQAMQDALVANQRTSLLGAMAGMI